MPSPRSGESRKDFISRCMGDSEAIMDFPNQDQRAAVCSSTWENRNKQGDISLADLEDGGKLSPQQVSRCPPGQRWDNEVQACVAERASHLKPRKPRRRAEELQPLGNRQQPDHNDPFLDTELTIAVALHSAVLIKAEEVDEVYDELLDDPVNFSEGAFQEATIEAQLIWQDTFGPAEAATTAAIALAIARGESQVSAGIIGNAPSRKAVLDGMVRASKFHTNEFFNTQVMPALQRQVTAVLEGTAATGQPNLSAIRAVLDRRLKSVPYWRVVANAAASRSYHYGYLKAAQFQGFRAYRFVAVIDKLTSEICNHMDGREWPIADVVNLMERAAMSDDIEDVKRLLPWAKFDDIRTLNNDALRDIGVMVPPLHGNCRSTIVPV